jgi:hypothetical protein
MKHLIPPLIALALSAGAAHAACYADYKARKDDPYGLHYGVAQISGACTVAQAQAELGPRLATDGWDLLSVEGVFDDAGLDERRDSAGPYFLRY